MVVSDRNVYGTCKTLNEIYKVCVLLDCNIIYGTCKTLRETYKVCVVLDCNIILLRAAWNSALHLTTLFVFLSSSRYYCHLLSACALCSHCQSTHQLGCSLTSPHHDRLLSSKLPIKPEHTTCVKGTVERKEKKKVSIPLHR